MAARMTAWSHWLVSSSSNDFPTTGIQERNAAETETFLWCAGD
jgi:hypothetical protein